MVWRRPRCRRRWIRFQGAHYDGAHLVCLAAGGAFGVAQRRSARLAAGGRRGMDIAECGVCFGSPRAHCGGPIAAIAGVHVVGRRRLQRDASPPLATGAGRLLALGRL